MSKQEQIDEEDEVECSVDEEHNRSHTEFMDKVDKLLRETTQEGALSVDCVMTELLGLIIETARENGITKTELQQKVSEMFDYLVEYSRPQLNG